MKDLFYYYRGRKTMPVEVSRELGLGYAAPDAGGPSCAEGPGPEGSAGVVFTFGDAPLKVPKDAVWRPVPGHDDEGGKPTLWVGFDPNDRPGPAELGRPRQFPGYAVELGDGQRWLVPVVRNYEGETDFPKVSDWDGKAWTHDKVRERYRELFDTATGFWDELKAMMTGAEDPDKQYTVNLDDKIGFAVSALAVNYRLGPAELALLKLFDSQVEGEVLLCALDWPGYLEMASKKEEAAGPSSSPGGTD